MADNFDLQGWMREQKQGPYAGPKGVEKVELKSSKPKSKTGLNESLMGMIDLKPIGSLSEEYDETYEEDGMEEGMGDDDDMDDAPEIEDTWNKPSEFDKDDDEEKMAAMAMKQAKSSKKGMKGVTADWTIDDILGGDDDDF